MSLDVEINVVDLMLKLSQIIDGNNENNNNSDFEN